MFDTKDNLYPLLEILPVLILLAAVALGIAAVCLLGRSEAS